jgi:hypothetical protein
LCFESWHVNCAWSLRISLTKDTTNWKNKKDSLEGEQTGLAGLRSALQDLNQEELAAAVAAAQKARNEAADALAAAEHGVEAATRELAGMLAAWASPGNYTLSYQYCVTERTLSVFPCMFWEAPCMIGYHALMTRSTCQVVYALFYNQLRLPYYPYGSARLQRTNRFKAVAAASHR